MQHNGSTYLTIEPHDPGVGQKVKIHFFYFIKLKGMEHRAPCMHIFSPYTHPQPVVWINR